MEFIVDLLYGLLFVVIIFLVLAGLFKCLLYLIAHSNFFSSRPRPVFISYLEPNSVSVSSMPISSVQQEFGSSAGVSRTPSTSEVPSGEQFICRQEKMIPNTPTELESLGCLKVV